MPSGSASIENLRSWFFSMHAECTCTTLWRVLETKCTGDILKNLGRASRRKRQNGDLPEDGPQLAEILVVWSRGNAKSKGAA